MADSVGVDERQDLFFQLLRDESVLTDGQLVDLFEFIYSYLVNRFKGELAEVLAAPVVRRFAEQLAEGHRLPPRIAVMSGSGIEARRKRGRRVQGGWYKGPDALLLQSRAARVVAGSQADRVAIAGVVEIKSYRPRLADLLVQLRNHARRLAVGLRLSGREILAAGVSGLVAGRDGCFRRVPLMGCPPDRLVRLVVRPSRRGRSARPIEAKGRNLWIAEIAPDAIDLSEAGYRFTDWFVGRLGAEVYKPPGQPGVVPDGKRVQNPWPSMTAEEAARNGLRQAMYFLGERQIFAQGRSRGRQRGTRRDRRARSTFRWLYNSLCYGYDRASGDVVQFPEDHPDLAPSPSSPLPPAEAFARKVHDAFSKGRLSKAREMLRKAEQSDPALVATRHAAWLGGMIAYREARFGDALARFPGPETGKHDHWWTRDQVMRARLLARAGRGVEARERLAEMESLTQWPNRAIALEVHAATALSHVRDDRAAAAAALDRATELLERFRDECANRADQELGAPPDIHFPSVVGAVLDMAAALADLDRPTEALDHLGRLAGLDGWEFAYIEADPLMASLLEDRGTRRRLAEWQRG